MNIFYIKNNDCSYTLFLEYLTPGETFENMLQLMRFSVYVEGFPNKNNGYFHLEIIISAAHMLGAIRGHVLTQKNLKWCKLVCFDVYFDHILS